MFTIPTPSLRSILIALAVTALIALVAMRSCSSSHQEAEQAKQDTRSANATAETALDAARTVIRRADEDATVDELVAAAKEEIDNAPSDQAAGAAARRAICRLSNYGDDPACRLSRVRSADVE